MPSSTTTWPFSPWPTTPHFEVAFTVPTANQWGVGVAKDRPRLTEEIDKALGAVISDGRLADLWGEWLGELPYPTELEGSPGGLPPS